MKAVVCTRYGPPEVLQLAEVEKPTPQPNEVLIKIHATTVTVADFRIRSFTVPAAAWLPARIALGITKPRKPILGVELAGEIESVGKDVTRFKKGDQVFAATLGNFGAYAEYICLPEDGPIALKPVNISLEASAAIPVGARTALHHLRKGKIEDGQKILVYGASGSVGTYTVQLAKHFGAEVTAVCTSGNFSMMKSLGADKVIDYTDQDFASKLEQYDMIFLAIDKMPFSLCNQHLKEQGVYINVTSPVKNLSMIWTSMTTKKRMIMGQNSPETATDLEYLKKLVEAGKLKPVIDRVYPLEEIVEAHRYVSGGHKKGNVVITIGSRS